jgi:hypothetical protein
MSKRLTNEIIDLRLIGRNIERIDNYIDKRTPIHFKCLIDNCGHIWLAAPGNVAGGNRTGCPKCANQIELTREEVERRIVGKPFVLLDDIKGRRCRPRFQCLTTECAYIWRPWLGHILYDNDGCPKCNGGYKLTNEEVDKRLGGRNIRRLDDYEGIMVPIRFECLSCFHIWTTAPGHIINGGSGCHECALGDNEKLVGEILREYGIIFERHPRIECLREGQLYRMYPDFYISSLNVYIEYNGPQHYQPVRFGNIDWEQAEAKFIAQQTRDCLFQNYCDDNNIRLIWIDGRKYTFSNLRKYIIETVIPLLKDNGFKVYPCVEMK